MAPSITVLWTAILEDDRRLLEALELAPKDQLLQVSKTGLPGAVLGAVARGAVVMVAARDEEATHALSLGVDEVLRTGEMTAASLKLALQRARVRAGVRETRFPDDDGTAFSLLAAAVGHDLV